jgi:signal transduction histidine kinase/ABC-type sugar transport system substrate-binding protein
MARPLRIGLNFFPIDPFWVEVCEAAAQRAQQLGLELIPTNAYYTMQHLSDDQQLALVEEVLGQELDALIGWDFPSSLAYRVLDAGVPVIPHGSEMPIRHPLSVVREGLYSAAQFLGAYVAKRLGERGHVLVIGGLLLDVEGGDGRSRVAGFRDTFQAYPQITWRHFPTHWPYEPAYRQIYDALQAHPERFDALVGLSDTLALAARDAARALGRLGPGTLIMGINGDPLALASIVEGSFTATVETSATDLGYQMVDLAHRAAQRLPLPERFNFSRMRLVTRENVADVALQKLIDVAELPNRLIGIRLHENQQRLAQLETSLEISRQIGSILDRWQLSHEIVRRICATYGYDHGQIFLWSEAEQRLVLDQPEAAPGQRLSLSLDEAGVLGRAVQRDELIFIPDARRSQRFPEGPDPRWPNTRSRVILPIHLGDQLLGLLDLHCERVTKQTHQELVGLQSLAAQLGVALRNAELYSRALDARSTAEVANQELEAFSYSISHDLRTPLRAIDGFSRILLEDYLPQLEPRAQHLLQRVRAAAQHMGQLIDDLLIFSRFSRQPLTKRPVSMADLVQQALQDLRPEYEQRPIQFAIGELPACQADPALLKQVVLNLLSNAIKYTRGRDVARVEVGAQASGDGPVYFVRDNGVGFDMASAHRLFGVFQRLHPASEEFEGTGVGLAIVQRILHRHGGRVWAESAVGQGATFYFTLAASDTR